MDILNKKERNKALLVFIILFIITMGIVVSALFFNIYFPFQENKILHAENTRMRKEMEIQDKFSFQLEKVKLAADSIGIDNKDDFFNEKLAFSILADMYKQLPKDSLKNKIMYNNIIIAYKDLIDHKKHLKYFSKSRLSMDSINQINKQLKQEYDKMKIDMEVCRQLYQAK